MRDSRFAGRLAGLVALGAAAFTVYGSLVPFDFRSRDSSEAVDAFHWSMTHRWWYESRSDAIVNVMLGVPLGFALLGYLRSGRRGPSGDVAVGAMVLPLCVIFAGAVEFSQLYTLTRTTAGSDVLCQGLGAAIGMGLWVLCGRWMMDGAEDAWSGAESSRRMLFAYLALLAFVQLLPMDITASPRDVYRKMRDQVVYVPFSEFERENFLDRTARLIQVFALYVPVGLLASRVYRLRGCVNAPLAVLLPLAMEALQLPVQSRTTNATDVVVGASGILVANWFARSRFRFAFLAVWFVGLAFISWQPFELAPNPPLAFDWVPGLPLERGHPLFALEDMTTKLVLFGIGGAILNSRRAFYFGLAVSGLLEAGQTVFASHTACITDVLLGGIGTWIGARTAGRGEGT